MMIGIMGAMAEEVALLHDHMQNATTETRGMREYHSGQLCGHDVVIVFSRWGKVAASSTATTLVERYGVDRLIFTGVAGAVDPDLNVGDIVIASSLVQHDLDVSPLPGLERFEVPLLGITHCQVEEDRVQQAIDAACSYLEQDLAKDVPADALASFGVASPKVVKGVIASGDQFIADDRIVQDLRQQLSGLQCVEMEGAAVAQVAYEHGIPCQVIRTISDKADHSAPVDFPKFVAEIASHFTCGSVLRLLAH